MREIINAGLSDILGGYDPAVPQDTADQLRDLWMQFDPKSTAGFTAEVLAKQKTVGIPVPVLKLIGKGMGKVARKRVDDFIPLARLLWDDYGREGRVVALLMLGAMELTDPETIIPLLYELCQTCISWEDADRVAMDALEPIVRKQPDMWLERIVPWLEDENPWVRRAAITVMGRLSMKHASYTAQCLGYAEQLLPDSETDVKRAVSFAIRLCARGDACLVRDFLVKHVPPADYAATWVLCDAVRSMAKAILPGIAADLLPNYTQWLEDDTLSSRDRRSIESAVKTLTKALA